MEARDPFTVAKFIMYLYYLVRYPDAFFGSTIQICDLP